MTLRWTIFIILFSFHSCNSKSTRYKVIVDNVEGLETGSNVIYKDRTIGFVTDMDLFNDSVIVYFTLNKGNQIPKGSTFIVQHPTLGISGLYVESSKLRETMTLSDTARGYRDTARFLFGADTAGARKRKEAFLKIADGIKEFVEATRDSSKR